MGMAQKDPSVVLSLARVAVKHGLTAGEVRSDMSVRARLMRSAGELAVAEAEWHQVAASVNEHQHRAALANRKTSGTCRACGQSVRWVGTPNGKRVPLDPLPCPTLGNVELRPSGSHLVALTHSPSSVPLSTSRPVYRAHAATCPQRQKQPRKLSAVPGSNPVCVVCRNPMDAKMHRLGERSHPTCSEVML